MPRGSKRDSEEENKSIGFSCGTLKGEQRARLPALLFETFSAFVSESDGARCGSNSSRLVESSVTRFLPGGVAFRYTVPWRAVEGTNRWYCIVARFNGSEDACDGWAEAEADDGTTGTIFCREVVSEAVYIESLPLVARLIPYCSR